MKRILLVADLKGWIFERHCNEIRNRLSYKYKIDIAYCRPDGKNINKMSVNYDIVYVLDPMPIAYPPKNKNILGCRAEWLYKEKGPDFFYKNGHGSCTSIKDNCSVFHVVNKTQFNIFKDIVLDKPLLLVQHGVNTDVFNRKKDVRQNNSNITIGISGRKRSNGNKGFDIIESACRSLNIKFISSTYEGNKLTMEEMPNFYNNIDVYVCMSETEGLCNPIMEAGAMGIPVISTRSGAAEEMIFDGDNGLLIERSENALKKALTRMMDYEVRNKYSINIEKEITGNWSWNKKIHEYDLMFEKFLEVTK